MQSFGLSSVLSNLKCQDCHLKFSSPHQLNNHKRRFCINSAFDSLQGLDKLGERSWQNIKKSSQLQPTKPSHQLKHSKGTDLTAERLEQDLKDINTYKRHNDAYRNYTHESLPSQYTSVYPAKKTQAPIMPIQQVSPGTLAPSLQTKLTQPITPSKPMPLRTSNFTEELEEYINKYDRKQPQPESSISPPTYITPRKQQSVLHKSNNDINKMRGSHKHNYATAKLQQLRELEHLYEQNGGGKKEFRSNIQKMIQFYGKMLAEAVQERKETSIKEKVGEDYQTQSRLMTPILKLRDLGEESANVNMINRQKQKLTMQTNAQQAHLNSSQMKQAQLKLQDNESKMGVRLPPQQTTQVAPQIFMLPSPYAPQSLPVTQHSNEGFKVLEKLIELKSEQNFKLLQMLLEERRQDRINITPFDPQAKQPTQIKQPAQIKSPTQVQLPIQTKSPTQTLTIAPTQTQSQLQPTPIPFISSSISPMYTSPLLQFNKPMVEDFIAQQKFLLALQQQQIDELKLVSQLPPELQEIKLKSMSKAAETRHRMEKEVLRHKLERLDWEQGCRQFKVERKLNNDLWATQERRRMLQLQMEKYVGHFEQQFRKGVQGDGVGNCHDAGDCYGYGDVDVQGNVDVQDNVDQLVSGSVQAGQPSRSQQRQGQGGQNEPVQVQQTSL